MKHGVTGNMVANRVEWRSRIHKADPKKILEGFNNNDDRVLFKKDC